MISIDFKTSAGSAIGDLDRYKLGLQLAKNSISEDSGGLLTVLLPAALQLDRFVAANIQVDTGRTKNSIFISSGKDNNGVFAGLFSNVNYAPYVGYKQRESSKQFFLYAADIEAPRALNTAANALVEKIEDGFL